jgi:hypothetical protein
VSESAKDKARAELLDVGGQDMPVSYGEVDAAIDAFEAEVVREMTTALERERKSVADLHEGLNLLFKEALQLRNENRRLKKRIKELERDR